MHPTFVCCFVSVFLRQNKRCPASSFHRLLSYFIFLHARLHKCIDHKFSNIKQTTYLYILTLFNHFEIIKPFVPFFHKHIHTRARYEKVERLQTEENSLTNVTPEDFLIPQKKNNAPQKHTHTNCLVTKLFALQ